MLTSPTAAGVALGDLPRAAVDTVTEDLVARMRGLWRLPDQLVASTHRVITGGRMREVVVITAPGMADWDLWHVTAGALEGCDVEALVVGRHAEGDLDSVSAARTAVEERRLRIGGRCVVYPGVEALQGVLSAGQIVAGSAIETVLEVGEDELPPDAEIITGGRLRPRWEFGSLTLHVQDTGAGLYLPFEASGAVRASGPART